MPSNASVLQTLVLGYLLGSIPFAYLIPKWATGSDVRREGSGNVGTRNALRVSRKRWVGIVVLIADMLKGAVPVLVLLASDPESLLVLVPALVLGHCYPIWLGFHGGKGLATTAGALLVCYPAFPIFWGAAYLVVKRLRNDSEFATIAACGASLVMLLLIPESWVRASALGSAGVLPNRVVLSVCVVVLIILSRHIEEFRELLRAGAASRSGE